MDKTEYRNNLLESLVRLNETARKMGIKMGAELTGDYDLVEKENLNNLGLTIDTGHVSFDSGAGYRDFITIGGLIERFGSKIFHMHLHDYDGESDHLAIGKGNIDFDEVITALKKINYNGSLCLELNPSKNSAEDILKSKAILSELYR
jgi:sugar phosphate isomerase/epimerase